MEAEKEERKRRREEAKRRGSASADGGEGAAEPATGEEGAAEGAEPPWENGNGALTDKRCGACWLLQQSRFLLHGCMQPQRRLPGPC